MLLPAVLLLITMMVMYSAMTGSVKILGESIVCDYVWEKYLTSIWAVSPFCELILDGLLWEERVNKVFNSTNLIERSSPGVLQRAQCR